MHGASKTVLCREVTPTVLSIRSTYECTICTHTCLYEECVRDIDTPASHIEVY